MSVTISSRIRVYYPRTTTWKECYKKNRWKEVFCVQIFFRGEPELLKKHSMNLSPFLHVASAFRIKFSASSSSKQLLPAIFR
jgi:hypothetical protein